MGTRLLPVKEVCTYPCGQSLDIPGRGGRGVGISFGCGIFLGPMDKFKCLHAKILFFHFGIYFLVCWLSDEDMIFLPAGFPHISNDEIQGQGSHTSQMRKFKGISRVIMGSTAHFQEYF